MFLIFVQNLDCGGTLEPPCRSKHLMFIEHRKQFAIRCMLVKNLRIVEQEILYEMICNRY